MQQAINALTQKIDELIKSLPDTYVSIRQHDQQMRAIDDRQNEHNIRIVALEEHNKRGTQWANDEHAAIKREWQGSLDKVNEKLSAMQTESSRMWLGFAVQVILMLIGFLFIYLHH